MAELEKKTIEVPPGAAPEAPGVPAKAETVESKPAAGMEAPRPVPEKISEQVLVVQPPPAPPSKGGEKAAKDELTQEIESVLAEDLGDIYKNLPPEKQQQFKEEGEKTAGAIQQMIQKGKVHGRKLAQLIVRWLKMIPGVNKFFLEQESKIKADKLIQIAEERKQKR